VATDLDQIAQEVRRHLERGDVEHAGSLVAVLQRAVPGSPTVQMLRGQLAVIGFPIHARRASALISGGREIGQDQIDLVAFHVDMPTAPSGIHDAIDYIKTLQLTFSAAAIKAPLARRIILTDNATEFPEGIGAHEIIRLALDKSALMYERMRLQLAYLQARPDGRASVLMDTDVVINRDPAGIFNQEFDIGLTWRTGFPDAPFNGGLIFVGPGRQGMSFFTDAIACYDNLAAARGLAEFFNGSLKAWWGDQFALAALAGYREFGQRLSDGVLVNEVVVAYLPCDQFNTTLDPGINYELDDLRRKYAIHFKGNRKGMLTEYVALLQAGRL
jgi:hypothetical protein